MPLIYKCWVISKRGAPVTPPFRLNTARRPNAGVAEELCPCGAGCIRSYKKVKLLKLGLGSVYRCWKNEDGTEIWILKKEVQHVYLIGAAVIIGMKLLKNQLYYCNTNKCLLNKPKQRSIVEKDPIFTLNIPMIRCKTPWYMRWKWVIFTQFAGGWGTHSGKDKADTGGMRKMVAQMINSSKIHELITYSAKALLSTLSPVNMRITLLRFIESWKYREKWRFLLRNFSVE